MEELNPTNAFGELLLDAIEAQYGSLDEGIPAVAASAGLDEDELVAIVQGDVVVEDESLLSDLIEALPDADDDDIELLINAAVEVDAADREELVNAIAETEDALAAEEEMPMEDEMVEDYGYQYSPRTSAVFSKVAELENKVASFEMQNAFSSALREVEQAASRYVEAGLLAPAHKAMLIGNFQDDSERLACFAAISEQNGVAPEVMLFATRYALGMLKDAAEFVEFKDYSLSDEDVAVATFSASLDEQVKADVDAIFNY